MKYKKCNIGGYTVTTCVEYDEHIRQLILNFKVRGDTALRHLMLDRFYYFLKMRFLGYAIVTVPPRESLTKDWVKILVEPLNMTTVSCTIRNNAKQKQAHLSKTEREKIQSHIFLEEPPREKYKKILVIDDIMTTGNTLYSVMNLLRPYGDRIEGLCYARSVLK